MKKIDFWRVLVLAICIITALVVAILWNQSNLTWDTLWQHLTDHPWQAALFLWSIYLIKVVIWPIPLKGLYIGAGLIFSPTLAILVSYIGLSIQMTAGFYFGRSMGASAVRPLLERNRYARKISQMADKNVQLSAVFLRLIPGPPADLVNMFLGSLDISYLQFLLISLLAITPVLVPVVFLGDAVLNPLSLEFLIPFSIMALITILTLFCRRLIMRRKATAEHETK